MPRTLTTTTHQDDLVEEETTRKMPCFDLPKVARSLHDETTPVSGVTRCAQDNRTPPAPSPAPTQRARWIRLPPALLPRLRLPRVIRARSSSSRIRLVWVGR
jgi:hypothetical protein